MWIEVFKTGRHTDASGNQKQADTLMHPGTREIGQSKTWT